MFFYFNTLTSIIGLVLAALTFAWIISKFITEVPEGAILKTFILGKAHKSYLAGLHIGNFDRDICKKIILKAGTIARSSSENSIELDGIQIPAKYSDSPKINSAVRIKGFEGTDPVVTHSNVPDEKCFTCEKCGYVNNARV